MLQDLIDLLNQHFPGQLKAIQNLANSCCSSSKLVYDFDAIKAAAVQGVDACKSADALLLVTSSTPQACTFIEMKDMKAFATRFQENYSKEDQELSQEALKQAFKETFVHEFQLDKKLFDSVMLLLDICAKNGINPQFFPFWMGDACKKRFLFVLGIGARDFVRFRIQILDAMYGFRYYKMPIFFIPAYAFDTLSP